MEEARVVREQKVWLAPLVEEVQSVDELSGDLERGRSAGHSGTETTAELWLPERCFWWSGAAPFHENTQTHTLQKHVGCSFGVSLFPEGMLSGMATDIKLFPR